MALSAAHRTLYQASLLRHQYANEVWGALTNRKVEGDIKQGNVLKIFSGVQVTGGAYDPSDVDAMAALRSALDVTEQTLTIDQFQAVGFYLDDVDKAFTNLDLLDEAAQGANEWLLDQSEAHLAARVIAQGTDYGATLDTPATAASPLSLSSAEDAYELLVDLKTAQDRANVPKAGRVAVIPPEVEGLLLKDARFVAYAQADARDNGVVGKAAGYEIVSTSRHATKDNSGDDVHCIVALNRDCLAFASAIDKVDAGKMPNSFKHAVDALQVYGSKVYRPTNVQYICVDYSS